MGLSSGLSGNESASTISDVLKEASVHLSGITLNCISGIAKIDEDFIVSGVSSGSLVGILSPLVECYADATSVQSDTSIGLLSKEFVGEISGRSIDSSVSDISVEYSSGINGLDAVSTVGYISSEEFVGLTGNNIRATETPYAFIKANADQKYVAKMTVRLTEIKYPFKEKTVNYYLSNVIAQYKSNKYR